jgi:hypothetical protein
MSEYVAGLCQMAGTELVPLEMLTIVAPNDEDAVRKAIEWQTSTVFTFPIDQRTWLQVLCGGRSIYSKEFGRI